MSAFEEGKVHEMSCHEYILTEEIPQPHKGKLQYHWRLTKDKYQERKAETL